MYDFLLVINTNLPRILHRFRDISHHITLRRQMQASTASVSEK